MQNANDQELDTVQKEEKWFECSEKKKEGRLSNCTASRYIQLLKTVCSKFKAEKIRITAVDRLPTPTVRYSAIR